MILVPGTGDHRTTGETAWMIDSKRFFVLPIPSGDTMSVELTVLAESPLSEPESGLVYEELRRRHPEYIVVWPLIQRFQPPSA